MLERRIPAVAFRRVVRSQECGRGRWDAGKRVTHAGECLEIGNTYFLVSRSDTRGIQSGWVAHSLMFTVAQGKDSMQCSREAVGGVKIDS